jgi:DNA topoisomerase-1
LLDAPTAERADRELGPDPVTGLPVLVRAGRYGPYIQLGRAEELSTKPKTSSLLSDMVPEEVTLEEALRLLTLPRTLGRAPEGGEAIVVDKGRYGPYVRKGTDYRSLETEDQLFTVTLADALDLFSRPRARGNRQASQPLAEIGTDPVSGTMITVREGRFGPYVTDGTVNASLRRGDSIESLTLERAAELLADRRARAEAEAAAGGRPVRGRAGRATGAGGGAPRTAGATAKARSGTKAAPRKAAAAKKAAAPARKAAAAKKAAAPARKAAAAKKAAASAKKAAAPD